MRNTYTPEEPIAAIATALAPSALAVIRTSGKNCIELVSEIFSRPKALLKAQGYTMVHGWIIEPEEKKRIDEVMLALYKAPKSFTGEDMVEIFCHGGTAPVLAIQKLLLKIGFRSAERGEFSFRAFINGKTDLTRAEAIKEIIESRTDESRSRAAGRLAGNLAQELDKIKQLLIRTAASIEAEIEYPEDEETIADAYDSSELEEARKLLKCLSDTWAGEKLYQDGARVVLCGRTNAGKSSLFNTLLKEERAIVSDIEGTTRDWIESWVSFGGIPARLFDTAGLRQSSDLVEQSGVERSHELAEDADLVLYLMDASQGLTPDDYTNLEELSKKTPEKIILVLNKCDLCATFNNDDKWLQACPQVRISARTGLGISELVTTVHSALIGQKETDRQQAGLGSERQKKAVDDALDSVSHALLATENQLGLDAVVQDIEDALASLAYITGETSPDDILGDIFSRFCVGK
ncbi:MAG: tRNA uridine-5-carboxymethylaminomethyl(34) synthesis GTPase MnmE [Treponemataceae bacterium]|nr:tRNA uridine-5-carboxymethylaminomethyl(34) synthesis GTPase MnmE [Treponemataceae bacterium]